MMCTGVDRNFDVYRLSLILLLISSKLLWFLSEQLGKKKVKTKLKKSAYKFFDCAKNHEKKFSCTKKKGFE